MLTLFRFFSFLQSTGGSLIDISLYVSAVNYNATTSSAYTAILPWYLNYTIPPRRREKARVRTSHLGLSSLDISPEQDAASQPGGRSLHSTFETAKKDAGAQSQTKVLSMGRAAGVGGLLSDPVYAARFKLDALANELLEPLVDLLGNKKYLFSETSPSSLDCLAFGYLALMLYPVVPQAWLKEALEQRFPRLSQYVHTMRQELIAGEEVKAADIWNLSSSGKDGSEIQSSIHQLGLQLPWRPRQARSFTAAVSKATLEFASKFPLLSSALQSPTIIRDSPPKSQLAIRSSLPSALAVNSVYAFAALVTATVAALAVQHRRSIRDGPLIFWALRPQAPMVGPGEAQELLSIFAGQLGV